MNGKAMEFPVMAKALKPRAKTHDEDPILDLTEAARQLGVHPVTVKRWILDGLLWAVRRPNGLIKIRESTVRKMLEAKKFCASVANEDVTNGR